MNFENLCCEYSMQAPYQTALKFTEHHNTFLEMNAENIPFFLRTVLGEMVERTCCLFCYIPCQAIFRVLSYNRIMVLK